MPLDTKQIGKDMIVAVAEVFDKEWPEIKEYAEDELKDFARVLGRISARYAAGKITEENARAMVSGQIKAMEIVFLAVEGLGILMVEAAINSAIDVVRTAVNKAIGFGLL
jgi:hypothetical protein